MTEYFWSDREAYEVVAVRDQKHVSVRRYDHRHIGTPGFDNNWELISNEKNPVRDLERRGDRWYWTTTVTAADIEGIEDDIDSQIRLALAGFDIDKIREKGKQTRRSLAKVSFGVADYYYDYSF